ncbi:Retrovirus-related Pol polyprotein from transposon RE1 [Vitis vinifera]|uniref:Retrovirus-related Pol polyprotein from transposon RE1 n=1 Tax=Vitis vinifera TaxID=29760 RepID=A0A438J7L8_VITVI|nr:Retrovirus-related Pol polyprotein from transposon RE1 [Vitis vinifera]
MHLLGIFQTSKVIVLSSETHRYFLSADVTFFEDSPFFSTFESLPVSEVLPFPTISPPNAMPSRPLQVYHRRHCVVVPPSLAEVLADSLPIPSASPAPALPPSADLPIAFRKGWRQAMVDEMATLHSNGTWDLLFYPLVNLQLVVVGSTQLRLALMLLFVYYSPWLLCILGLFIRESGLVCKLRRSSIWLETIFSSMCIYLVVYVDDIVITGSDQNGIQKLKQHLFTHFQTKDLGKLKYFLGIEIAQSNTPMDPNVKLIPRQREPLRDPGRYRRLVGKLNYLTSTRPDISFPVSVVSQFLQSPCDSHWDAIILILRYIKSTPSQGVLYENRGHTQIVGYTDVD